jgi:hypothetical protein
MPGTQVFFRNLKRDWLRHDHLARFRLDPELRQPGFSLEQYAPSDRTVRDGVAGIESYIAWAADQAWSIDQSLDRFTLMLGLGPGIPIQLRIEGGKPDAMKFEDELLAHAKKIAPDLERTTDVENQDDLEASVRTAPHYCPNSADRAVP